MKTSELTGAQLAKFVAIAEGHVLRINEHAHESLYSVYASGDFIGYIGGGYLPQYAPHKLWEQGGPIIEREGMGVAKKWAPADGPVDPGREFGAISLDDRLVSTGPTMLVAAMRCYVASKYGEEFALPFEAPNA